MDTEADILKVNVYHISTAQVVLESTLRALQVKFFICIFPPIVRIKIKQNKNCPLAPFGLPVYMTRL